MMVVLTGFIHCDYFHIRDIQVETFSYPHDEFLVIEVNTDYLDILLLQFQLELFVDLE